MHVCAMVMKTQNIYIQYNFNSSSVLSVTISKLWFQNYTPCRFKLDDEGVINSTQLQLH